MVPHKSENTDMPNSSKHFQFGRLLSNSIVILLSTGVLHSSNLLYVLITIYFVHFYGMKKKNKKQKQQKQQQL